MAYLTIEELKTHLYRENVEAITGGDDTIVLASIDGAIQEAKGVPRPLRLQGYL